MAFTTTNSVPQAKVTIKFAGLMLLKPNGPDACKIGVHRLSQEHLFQAILTKHKPNLPPTLVRLTTGSLQGQFNMYANRTGAAFRVFQTDNGAFDRASSSNHELDYRWGLNLSTLHPNADYNAGATPEATLNDGVLYTSNLTRLGHKPVLTKTSGGRMELIRVTGDLAAALDLPPGKTLRLSWTDSIGSQTFDLPRQTDPLGTAYTLTLLNEPPGLIASPHDELAYYYDVLRVNGAPITDKWQLVYEGSPKNDEIPCLPIILNS